MSRRERASVVVARSSCDLFRLIAPRARGCYLSPPAAARTAIEFSLGERVRATAARLTSADAHFLRSYRIVAVGRRGDEVACEEDADEALCADGAQVTRRFAREVAATAFRIEQTGPAADGGNAFALRAVELLADGFEPGFFEAKLARGDAAGIDVAVTTEGIDPRTGRVSARTLPGRKQWIEIEFTEGCARVEGFAARGGQRFAIRGADGDRWDDIQVEPDGAHAGIDEFRVVRRARKYTRVRVVPVDGDDPIELVDFDLIGEYLPKRHH
jgi:hypothetical protein